MEKRRFGNTDMHVSVLGFGGSEIGYQGVNVRDVKNLLASALDAGLNVIDTAECYRESEELIGEAVSDRRSDFYLFTKCGHAAGFAEPDWTPAMLQKSIERSLARLKTDHVDLIQLHSCSEDMLRQGDVIDILRRAKEAGKTRYIGYSGDRSAARYAIECGAFDALQTSVNIADQEPIELTIPHAAARNMGVIAKRPIANAAWKTKEKPTEAYHHAYWERLQKLQYDFLEGNLSDAVGVALRFTLSIPGVQTAIVGTTQPGRWQENARLLERGPLPEEMFAAIRRRFHDTASPDWVGQT